jgi:biotin carboxylase
MPILILNSIRGKNIPYPAWLKNTNEKLFLLCSDQQTIDNENYHYTQSFEQYEKNSAVTDAAAMLIEKHQIKTVIAKSECDLLRAGKLRDALQIEGQNFTQALAFRDKVVMKSYLEKSNLRIPAYRRIQNKLDAIAFSNMQGFPLVLKPVDGAGSLNTVIIENLEQMQTLPDALIENNMEIEEYIAGEMYHVDGIVLNGEVKFIYPSKYFHDCLRYQHNESSGSCILEYHHPLRERLIDFTKSILAALPTPAITTFHAEIFHTPEDELVFCEIASRTGGVRIREMLHHAFDIDLDQLWIQAQANALDIEKINWPSKPNTIAGWVLVPPREGTLRKFPTDDLPDDIVEYQQNGVCNKRYQKPEKSSDCIASFVATGDSVETVIERLNQAENWFTHNAEWE